MKNTLLTLVAAAALSAVADPTDPQVAISSVTQPEGKYQVTVGYSLDEDAVITMDVMTNGVSIGGQNINHVIGDCFKLVKAGTGTFTWYADKSWPGHRIDENIVTIEVKAWAKISPPDFMAIDLMGNFVNYYPSKEFLPGGITDDLYKTSKLLMRKIHSKGVSFVMGSPSGEVGRNEHMNNRWSELKSTHSELQKEVVLDHDFYIGVYEFTQRQYELSLGSRANSYFSNADCYAKRPVQGFDFDTLHWENSATGGKIRQMKDRYGISSLNLPLEAEWEFACRAGTTSALYTGKELTSATGENENLNAIARYRFNGGNRTDESGTLLPFDPNWTPEQGGTAEVGSYEPNAFDLYDMLGNVWELTRSYWVIDIRDVDVTTWTKLDGIQTICVRGGCWYSQPYDCRAACRQGWRTDGPSWSEPREYYGFRLSCAAVAEK